MSLVQAMSKGATFLIRSTVTGLIVTPECNNSIAKGSCAPEPADEGSLYTMFNSSAQRSELAVSLVSVSTAVLLRRTGS